jgi:hypothetical protein
VVLDGISQLTANTPESIRLADWSTLAKLPVSRSTLDVQNIFFPGAPAEVLADPATKGSLHRRPKFLTTVDAATYQRIYQTILESPNMRFPDFHAVLREGRRLGKVMSQVTNHVVHWLNASPTKVGERDPNKPLLWHNFLPAFDGEISQRSDRARHLQRQIFEVVRPRVEEFTDSINHSYLSMLPRAEDESYPERFTRPAWRDLLITIHRAVGAQFQEPLCKFNTEDPESLPSQPQSTFTQALAAAIGGIPDVSRNPALSSSQALEILMAKISPIVTAWAAEQCKAAPKAGSSTPMSPEAFSTAEIIVAPRTLPDVEIPESTQADDDEQDIVEFMNYLQRGAEEPHSDTSHNETTPASVPENQKATLQTTSLLLDDREMRIQRSQHRQNRSGRSTGNPNSNHEGLPEVLCVEEPRNKSGPLNATSMPAKKPTSSKRKLSDHWRKRPAAHAGSSQSG